MVTQRTVQGPASEELFALSPSQNRINGMGTGIVIDPRGYIVTNQHVSDWPSVTSREHPVDDVPAGCKRVLETHAVMARQFALVDLFLAPSHFLLVGVGEDHGGPHSSASSIRSVRTHHSHIECSRVASTNPPKGLRNNNIYN